MPDLNGYTIHSALFIAAERKRAVVAKAEHQRLVHESTAALGEGLARSSKMRQALGALWIRAERCVRSAIFCPADTSPSPSRDIYRIEEGAGIVWRDPASSGDLCQDDGRGRRGVRRRAGLLRSQ